MEAVILAAGEELRLLEKNILGLFWEKYPNREFICNYGA